MENDDDNSNHHGSFRLDFDPPIDSCECLDGFSINEFDDGIHAPCHGSQSVQPFHDDSSSRGVVQSSYQIFWSESADFDRLEECDVVVSSTSTLVPLICNNNNTKLVSDQIYYWKVVVTLTDGSIGSGSTQFRTGILYEEDWKAQWITPGSNANNLIRRAFYAPLPIQTHVTLLISGIGYYQVYLHGR